MKYNLYGSSSYLVYIFRVLFNFYSSALQSSWINKIIRFLRAIEILFDFYPSVSQSSQTNKTISFFNSIQIILNLHSPLFQSRIFKSDLLLHHSIFPLIVSTHCPNWRRSKVLRYSRATRSPSHSRGRVDEQDRGSDRKRRSRSRLGKRGGFRMAVSVRESVGRSLDRGKERLVRRPSRDRESVGGERKMW